uniref:Uncharacterized protein n=1 Tax=Compsopogon caeruleus TaxID=31354 RepID=A0A7S1TIV7_9RHOD|mmetsp:Transcript_921/g.1990  ORF Transcript_921/g.1990 Transcript_921/m.1990 type:complete len:293 (+) Transcript_921:98-976(+)
MDQGAADDGDTVELELDLYLSRSSQNSDVYLLQYPTHEPGLPRYEGRNVVAGRVRPLQRRIELDYALVPTALDCNLDRVFDLSQNKWSDGELRGETFTMRSTEVIPPPRANLCVMHVDLAKGAAVMVPIDAVTQMRHSFRHLDLAAAEENAMADEEGRRDDDGGGTTTGDEGPDPPAEEYTDIGITFKKRESERATERKKNSYGYLNKLQENEAWKNVRFFPHRSSQAQEGWSSLFGVGTVSPAETPIMLQSKESFQASLSAVLQKSPEASEKSDKVAPGSSTRLRQPDKKR